MSPGNAGGGGVMGEAQDGGPAEICRAKARQLGRIPDAVGFEQAAALPVAYGTAIRMMNTIGKIKPGEKVLILGASGGVGVGCVELAKPDRAYLHACAGREGNGGRPSGPGGDAIMLFTTTCFT